jgi:hypothetical protein
MVAPNELIPSRHRNLLGPAILVVLVCWLGFNWLSTVSHIVRYYDPLPVSDYWRVIEDLPAMEAGDWSWLWRQHNEHRIVFPELVFAADELLFSGQQVLPLITSFSCYLSTLILLGCTFWRSVNAPAQVKLCALLLGGVIAGWPLSAFVLGTPFLLQWTLLQFAVVLGLSTVSSSGLIFPVYVTCGVLATFSSANGILLWPVLLGVAAYRGVSRGRLIALALSAVTAVGVFFIGYERPTTGFRASLQHPASPFGFVLSYLSMPFGVLRHPGFGFVFGLLSLAVWVGCFAGSFRRRTRSISRYEVLAFGYFSFLLLTATLTSVGRMDLGDPGFSNAKAARYLTLPLLGWALCIPLLITVSLREQWRLFAPRTILLVTIVTVGFMEIRLGRWLRTNDNYVSHQQWAAVSLENGLFDPATVGSVFPDQAFVQHYLPILQTYGKSIFADPAFAFLGQDFQSLFPQVNRRLGGGGILRTARFPGGLSIVGWAAHLRGGRRTTVVLVNETGKIVGLGRHLRAGIPRELSPLPVDEASTWVGYVNERYPSKYFTPYVVATNNLSASPVGPETNIRERAR